MDGTLPPQDVTAMNKGDIIKSVYEGLQVVDARIDAVTWIISLIVSGSSVYVSASTLKSDISGERCRYKQATANHDTAHSFLRTTSC